MFSSKKVLMHYCKKAIFYHLLVLTLVIVSIMLLPEVLGQSITAGALGDL